jgi:hypothetical protein
MSAMVIKPYYETRNALLDLKQIMTGLQNLTKSTVDWTYDRYETRRIVYRKTGRVKKSNALQVIGNITNQVEEYQSKIEAYYVAYMDMIEMNIVYADAISNLTVVWANMLDSIDQYSRIMYENLIDLQKQARRSTKSIEHLDWIEQVNLLKQTTQLLRNVTDTMYHYSLQAYWAQAANKSKGNFNVLLLLIAVCCVQMRNWKLTFLVFVALMTYVEAGSIKQNPKAEALVYIPEVIVADFKAHANCLARARTIELGQETSASEYSGSTITCLQAMKSVSQVCDTSDNGVQEKYLGCSKSGLPQLGYMGTYVSVKGSLSISQLPCSRHMNLACLNDDVLLTLLSRQLLAVKSHTASRGTRSPCLPTCILKLEIQHHYG